MKVFEENSLDIKEIVPNGNYYDFLGIECSRVPMVMREFSGWKCPLLYKVVFFIAALMMKSLSKKEVGRSKELMHGGFMVVGVKK